MDESSSMSLKATAGIVCGIHASTETVPGLEKLSAECSIRLEELNNSQVASYDADKKFLSMLFSSKVRV